MPFKPLLTGDAIIEITAGEYFGLARKAERIDAVERFVSANEFVSVKDILVLLDIMPEKKEERKIEE